MLLSHSTHLLAGVTSGAAHFRLGVDLFAISGFLITTLLLREQSAGRLSLRRFYLRRAFRILPLVVTYLAVLSAIAVFRPAVVSGWEMVSSLLFARNYLMHWSGPATNHFWSLSVEEHLYLLWPFVLAWLGPARALRVALVGALGCSLWRAVDARYALFAALFGEDAGVLFRTDTRFDALLWGAVAAFAAPRFRGLAENASRFPVVGAVFGSIVLFVSLKLPLQPTALALLFPLLVLSTVLRPSTFTARALELRPLTVLGRLSYSLYVW